MNRRAVVFCNETGTTEIYTLALHDDLPISARRDGGDKARREAAADAAHRERLAPGEIERRGGLPVAELQRQHAHPHEVDRKSTRLNSSHANISYAVFCL